MPVTMKGTKKQRGHSEAALCLGANVPIVILKPQNRKFFASAEKSIYIFSSRVPG